MVAKRPLRVGVVAGEASGDLLGARALSGLRERVGEFELTGVGGVELRRLGLKSLYPMERLAVMGISEPLRRLPELLRLRRKLRAHFLAEPPDMFLGVDAPEFNLPLARSLRGAGIRAVHLVSPSVWAWRSGRVAGIARSVDLLLCLFPFEPAIYRAAGLRAAFVGHPLADELAAVEDRDALRRSLGLPARGPLLALLPGSRVSEVRHLAPVFLQVARRLYREGSASAFVVPVADPACRPVLAPLLTGAAGGLPLHLVDGRSRAVLAAADAVLTASGTATLEAALLGRPMVVAYRMSRLSWFILSRMVHSHYAALPNIIAGAEIVPEFLQTEANADNLHAALAPLLTCPAAARDAVQACATIAGTLRQGFRQRAASEILQLLEVSGDAQ